MAKLPTIDTDAVARQASAAGPYLQQLISDVEVQKSVRDLIDHSRSTVGTGSKKAGKAVRGRTRKARKAASRNDELQDRLTAVVRAVGTSVGLVHQPPPKKKRSGRALLVLPLGAAAYVAIDSGARARLTGLISR
jgi:hypothetical protein